MTKSRSPFFTKALSFAGSCTSRPLTSGAISMKFARTLASSVRGLRSVSRMTSNRTTTEATITPTPILRPHRLRSTFSAACSICSSLTEENQPQQTCEEDYDAWIEERQQPDSRLEAIAEQKVANNECQDDPRGQADHPCRKEGTNHIDRRRTSTPGQQKAEGRNARKTSRGLL